MEIECTNNGDKHSHESWSAAMLCYGVITREKFDHDAYVARMGKSIKPVASDLRLASDAQVDYVAKLNGDVAAARVMTRRACSQYIDALKNGTMPQVQAPAAKPDDSKYKIEYDFLDLLAEGYYAARTDEKDAWRFYFVSRPKSGQYKGAIKVQRQIGSGYTDHRWEPCYIAWPSKSVSVLNRDQMEHVMICISGQGQAMRDYAEQIGRCCRCNALLTDKRSLWYGIGPECEKSNRGLIEDIGLEKGFFEDQPQGN